MFGAVLIFLLIGLGAGWLAGKIVKGRGFGLVGNTLLGVVGALVGMVLFMLLGLRAVSLVGAFVGATAGSIAVLALARYLRDR
jgi:uncharacterized membrane protein YeaQ/YmgE (transglycosylase-associated protein family)